MIAQVSTLVDEMSLALPLSLALHFYLSLSLPPSLDVR